MLNPTSFRSRLALRLIAAVLPPMAALAASGCCSQDHITASIPWPADQPCPPPAEAFEIPDGNSCHSQLVSVDGEGVRDGDQCTYPVTYEICDCHAGFGRPYREAEAVITADSSPGAAWVDAGVGPDVASFSADDRRALAARFRRQALLEHASIASFARAAIALMAAGAPPDLVAGAHRAALDEVEHARLCFALASAFAGTPEGPGRFPAIAGVADPGDLVRLAADTVLDGCIEETLSTIEAAEALDDALDPAVRAVLERIVRDETAHAELAWRTVAWAIGAGGPEAARAVAEVFAEERRSLRGASRRRAFDDVVLPAARALLGYAPVGDERG